MPNNYVLLETIALTQSAASVTFDNLPTSGYTDLKIVMTARYASGSGFALIDFNNLSTANFSNRVLEGTGSSAISFVAGNTNYAGGIVGAGDTANTFSNTEIYIPNYRSSAAKSYSIDAVTENNGTTAYADMVAGLWNNTAAITAVKLSTHSGANFAVGSTFSLYGIAAFGTTPVLAPKATGGNIVANDGTYWYHAFTSSGNFVPQVGLTADVLQIAGGGGGGADGNGSGGGGGAGGLLAFTSQSLVNGTNYACTIGAGGAGGLFNGAGGDGQRGANGSNSSLTGGSLSLTNSVGGGGGATSRTSQTAGSGGSGGGATYNNTTAGSASPSGQGNNGGTGVAASGGYFPGAGGGGAGAAGGNAVTNLTGAGAGGAGLSTYSSWGLATLTGQNVSGTHWYAGGGGGGMYNQNAQSGTGGAGGNGGGGTGGYTTNAPASSAGVSGTANTGGGGGASPNYTGQSSNNGGAGGSGVIIIRYPIA